MRKIAPALLMVAFLFVMVSRFNQAIDAPIRYEVWRVLSPDRHLAAVLVEETEASDPGRRIAKLYLTLPNASPEDYPTKVQAENLVNPRLRWITRELVLLSFDGGRIESYSNTGEVESVDAGGKERRHHHYKIVLFAASWRCDEDLPQHSWRYE